MSDPLRLRCVLGKFRCVAITRNLDLWQATIQVTDGYQMRMMIPDFADLRPGDLLTLYTEIPTKEHVSALPQPTPIK